MLRQFKEEMENIFSQWKEAANEKAEKILNAALESGKEAMSRLLQESPYESTQAMKKMITDSLAEARDMAQKAKKFSQIAWWLSVSILTISGVFSYLIIG